METVWTAFIWAFRILSKMAARSWIITPQWPLVSLFLRFLFNLNFVLFYGCFPLDFVWKWYEIKELTVIFFRFHEVWMKKPMCTFSYCGRKNGKIDVHIFPATQCARRFFHSYLKETKYINNQFSNKCMYLEVRGRQHQGTKFWCQPNPLVTSVICYKCQKISLKADFIHIFS